MSEIIYDFNGRLKREFPSQVIVDITERCNFACIHCPHSQFAQSDIYAARDLSFEVVKKVADEVHDYGQGYCQQIRFASEGEPFLNKDVYKMLSYTVEQSGVFVSITTNGSTLTHDNVLKLLDTGISMVDISIDAYTEETYNKIRVGGNFKRVVAGVQDLICTKRELGSKTKVIVSYVKQPDNKHEADDFKHFWEQEGVDYVVMRDLHTAGGANMQNKMEVFEETRRPCVYPWERVSINPDNKILFCPADWQGKAEIGDYTKETIHEIWKSDKYQNLRDMHIHNCYADGHMCEECKDWATTAWPGSDRRGYGDMIAEFTEGDI